MDFVTMAGLVMMANVEAGPAVALGQIAMIVGGVCFRQHLRCRLPRHRRHHRPLLRWHQILAAYAMGASTSRVVLLRSPVRNSQRGAGATDTIMTAAPLACTTKHLAPARRLDLAPCHLRRARRRRRRRQRRPQLRRRCLQGIRHIRLCRRHHHSRPHPQRMPATIRAKGTVPDTRYGQAMVNATTVARVLNRTCCAIGGLTAPTATGEPTHHWRRRRNSRRRRLLHLHRRIRNQVRLRHRQPLR